MPAKTLKQKRVKCEKRQSLQECELAIVRTAVDTIEELEGKSMVDDPKVRDIIAIMEDFMRDEKLICYGGTAINNILPEEDQFYNHDIEIPDYDCYSPKALDHAKKLADIYFHKGYTEVEAKSGVHVGTFKVFVNFIPVADLTQIVPELYKNIRKDAISIDGILYCPPNFLRMAMYLELSRPRGDVSRWEKVAKRLALLNKNFPLEDIQCKDIEIQRLFDTSVPESERDELFDVSLKSLSDNGVVFFGSMAQRLYMKHLPEFAKKEIPNVPDFDVLSTDPARTARILKERLEYNKFTQVKITKRPGVGEIIAPHYEVTVAGETVVFIYQPIACHSYNVIKTHGKSLKIATIDTMLNLYLAFLYVNRPYYNPTRILCMCEALFKIQERNRLSQDGVLRRFSINCYGKQETIQDMRAEKVEKYKELKDKKGTTEYERYFLKYSPYEEASERKERKMTRKMTQKKRKSTKWF
jgi:hypothetical protein